MNSSDLQPGLTRVCHNTLDWGVVLETDPMRIHWANCDMGGVTLSDRAVHVRFLGGDQTVLRDDFKCIDNEPIVKGDSVYVHNPYISFVRESRMAFVRQEGNILATVTNNVSNEPGASVDLKFSEPQSEHQSTRGFASFYDVAIKEKVMGEY